MLFFVDIIYKEFHFTRLPTMENWFQPRKVLRIRPFWDLAGDAGVVVVAVVGL